MVMMDARPACAAPAYRRFDDDDFNSWLRQSHLRRRMASPLAAAVLLTAAVFLLPGTPGTRDAGVVAPLFAEMTIPATHSMQYIPAPARE